MNIQMWRRFKIFESVNCIMQNLIFSLNINDDIYSILRNKYLVRIQKYFEVITSTRTCLGTEGENNVLISGGFKHWRLPKRISVATPINEIFSLQVESYRS